MNTETRDEVVQIHLDDIIPNRFQPREVFDERALKELAVSIKEHGVIQPIIVRNVNGKYEIIAGERRYKASALAGLTKIPAIIRDLDDKESSKVALLENLQRKNLNPIEEARTYQKILEIDEMTQEELARTMGKSQSSVANKIRLLSLPEDVQDAILKEKISERHARALLNVSDSEIQKQLLDKIVSTKMSVRALEEEIKELYPKTTEATEIPMDDNVTTSANGIINQTPLTPEVKEIEEEISNYGKVVIAPPIENERKEEEDDTNRFINYGIDEDIEAEKIQGTPGETVQGQGQLTPMNPMQPEPVAQPQPAANSELDNLLDANLAARPTTEQKDSTDYFDVNEIPSIKVPDVAPAVPTPEATTSAPQANPLPSIVQVQGNYTPEQASQKIKDLIEDLKLHGVSVNADEMNFPKSYQIIIKIDKPE